MDVLVLIDKLDDLVHNAKTVPMTGTVRVDQEEIYDILDQMRATIPEEIKQARWIVKERQEMLAEAKREAERIVKEARERQTQLDLAAGGHQAGRAPGGGHRRGRPRPRARDPPRRGGLRRRDPQHARGQPLEVHRRGPAGPRAAAGQGRAGRSRLAPARPAQVRAASGSYAEAGALPLPADGRLPRAGRLRLRRLRQTPTRRRRPPRRRPPRRVRRRRPGCAPACSGTCPRRWSCRPSRRAGRRCSRSAGSTPPTRPCRRSCASTGAGARVVGHLPTPLHDAAAATAESDDAVRGRRRGRRRQPPDPAHPARRRHAAGRAACRPAPPTSAAAAVGGVVYVVGGYTGDRAAALDPRACAAPARSGWWRRCRDRCATPRSRRSAGQVLIAGGTSGTAARREVLSFDPRTRRLRRIARLPQRRHARRGGVARRPVLRARRARRRARLPALGDPRASIPPAAA